MNDGMKNSIVYTLVQAVIDKSDKEHVIIAIDGPSASGKTMFSKTLKNTFDCNVFHMDDFFLTPERKTPERLAEPGGNVDWERVKETVLENIVKGEPFTYEIYNCQTGQYTKTPLIKPKKLNVVEGVYAMHPELVSYYDFKIFFDVARPKQLDRILKRSNARMLARYKNEWIPLEDKYFAAYNAAANADFSFNTTRAF